MTLDYEVSTPLGNTRYNIEETTKEIEQDLYLLINSTKWTSIIIERNGVLHDYIKVKGHSKQIRVIAKSLAVQLEEDGVGIVEIWKDLSDWNNNENLPLIPDEAQAHTFSVQRLTLIIQLKGDLNGKI